MFNYPQLYERENRRLEVLMAYPAKDSNSKADTLISYSEACQSNTYKDLSWSLSKEWHQISIKHQSSTIKAFKS